MTARVSPPRLLLSTLLVATALVLPTAGCSQGTTTDGAFGAKVKAYLMAHPEVIEEALKQLEAVKTAKAEEEAKLAIVKDRAKLEQDPSDFVANPAGKITVVEFFDYKCPYCKTSADAVVKMVHDNPDVRFVFKEFPILSETSSHAAVDQLLTVKQGRYLDVFTGLMNQPALTDDTLAGVLRDKGVNLALADTPEARLLVDKHLADNRLLAHDVGVEGTPAFIVNGKRIDGWSPEDLQAGIDAQRKKGGAAGSL